MTRRRNAYFGILVFWIGGTILVLTIALFSHVRRQEQEEKRDDQVRNMVSEIAENSESTFIVDPYALPVAGEEEDWPDYEPDSPSEMSTGSSESSTSDRNGSSSSGLSESSDSSASTRNSDTSEGSENPEASGNSGSRESGSGDPPSTEPESSASEYVLSVYGTLSIPAIDCELPLWDGAGTIELRYGAGRMPLSCEAGEPGNLVIFGHRMRRDGSLFNRLGQVVIGDTISILRNGSTFTYQIDQIETIEPSRLSYYMYLEEDADACRITLITCTPVGVGTHRLVIIGHLVSS